MPEDIPERVKGWAEGEEAKARERDELVGEVSAAMEARGYDPTPIREAIVDEKGRSVRSRLEVGREFLQEFPLLAFFQERRPKGGLRDRPKVLA